MRIALIETFYGGSHKDWIDNLIQHSNYDYELFSLRDKRWKWKVHGGTVDLGIKFKQQKTQFDLVICSSMVDVALFKAVSEVKCPCIVYCHENQFAYPGVEGELQRQEWDAHYAFINYTSALVADTILYNSNFNKNSFHEGLRGYLQRMPKPKNLQTIAEIEEKSGVLYPGIKKMEVKEKEKSKKPCFLWNHRWEHDKNPDSFFKSLVELKQQNISFEVVVLGEQYKNSPKIFEEAKELLSEEIIHWGYAASKEEYESWLAYANILFVTSHHDFFGISVMEALQNNLYPLLPDRIVYPELYGALGVDHFYKTDKEAALKLGTLVTESLYIDYQLPIELDRFYWSNIVTEYEQRFVQVLKRE